MKKLTPKPSIEVLTSRLINSQVEKPKDEKQLSELDESKLMREFGDKKDFPNKTRENMIIPEKERYRKIEEELEDVLGDEDEKDEKEKFEFTDPREIKEYLDRFVEGQDEPKKALAVGLVDYLQHGIRKGILFIGPSGTGKTYMLEILAKKAGIKVVKKSLANVSSEGYKGQNLSEGLEELVGCDKSILFLDELDKIAIDSSEVGGFAPKLQNELLAYFTGEKIKLANMMITPDQLFGGAVGKKPQDRTIGKAKIYVGCEDGRLKDFSKNYVSSISSFLIENGIEPDPIILEDRFEEVPDEVARNIKKKLREYKANDPMLGCAIAVEFQGLEGRYFINPKKEELAVLLKEAIARKQADKKKGKKEEPKDPPNVIDLSKVLIVTAGAFHGSKNNPSLYKIIQRRLGGKASRLDETEILRHVEDKDLIEYGLKPELVGRLHCREVLKPHSVEGLYRILKYSEDSPLDRIKKIFDQIGITINFDDPSLLLLAEYAHKGIGVRGIHKMLDEITTEFSYNRADNIGKVINFTRSDLEKLLKKKVEFIMRDKYEVDWTDIGSILGYLDLYVPNQNRAKKDLAKAFHLYHVRMSAENEELELPMANLLVVGPTGSGKTYMINLLAKKAGLPIATTNVTGKVPEGIIGTRLADVFEQFSEEQKYGIVCIDEVDKILLEQNHPLNNELIGMLEQGDIRGRDASNYLFVLSGAFQRLGKLKQKMGDVGITKEDLEEVGIRDELLGRIPIIVNVEPPSVETLIKVLEGVDSPIEQYSNYFGTRGYKLELEKGVSELVAEHGVESEYGFRALKTLCERLFDEYMINPKKYANDNRMITIKLEDATRVLTQND